MPLGPPTDCPYYLVSRVSLLMTAAFKKAFASAGLRGLRPAYLGVLWCLWQAEGTRVIELGRCAGLEPSTMTGLLDRMERDGWVVRTADPEDRRAQRVELTDMGRSARDTVVRIVDETLAAIFVGIPDAELDAATGVLERVLENAREQLDGRP